ncbi:MAG TPA: DUF4286 family protein [Pyrinomonadaceae bacterium]|nr:DUF4286 family protein [Pyrinomonadaceae bacterium]HMP65784.1 DUF4286 family protein [Pyrinomonadaceae bacterium]
MNDRPVTYEVTCSIAADLCEEFEIFMCGRHIPEILSSGLFTSASFAASTPGRYRIRYAAHDRTALDRYLSTFADGLRTDFADRFPTGVLVTREEWTILRRFEAAKT